MWRGRGRRGRRRRRRRHFRHHFGSLYRYRDRNFRFDNRDQYGCLHRAVGVTKSTGRLPRGLDSETRDRTNLRVLHASLFYEEGWDTD